MDASLVIKQEDIKQEWSDFTYEYSPYKDKNEIGFEEITTNLELQIANGLHVPINDGRSNLDEALQAHGKKSFQCPDCSFCSARKNGLSQHRKTHTSGKPFTCRLCKFTCVYKKNMTRHMQIHNGNKPFRCSICRYASSQKGNLQRHMQSHFDRGSFKCAFCGRTSCREADMRKHMRVHTGEKPFRCPVCKFKASQRSDLQEHMKIHLPGNGTISKQLFYSDKESVLINQEGLVKSELLPLEEVIIKCENDVYS